MIKRFALTHIKPVLFLVNHTHVFVLAYSMFIKIHRSIKLFRNLRYIFDFSLYLFIIYVYTYMYLYLKININMSILQNIRWRQNNMYDKLFFYYQNQIHLKIKAITSQNITNHQFSSHDLIIFVSLTVHLNNYQNI